MSVQNHHRQKIISESQHLYEHGLFEFPYSNPSLPGNVLNSEQALDYVFEILYPKMRGKVLTPADLPTGIDTPNIGDIVPTVGDQRVVVDDGDGKEAIYMWGKWDGQATEQWNKIADMDWGEGTVISGLLDQTQYLYPRKYGNTDYDPITELPLLGKESGQHYYGGDLANQNLTLHANNGDDPAVHTGFVQVDDDFRPLGDLEHDLGTVFDRWKEVHAGTIILRGANNNPLTITSDDTRAYITAQEFDISFGFNNLVTTGRLESYQAEIKDQVLIYSGTGADNLTINPPVNSLPGTPATITSSSGVIRFLLNDLHNIDEVRAESLHAGTGNGIHLSAGLITDDSGAISFDNENLTTTGTLSAGAITGTELNIDNINIDGNTISNSLLDDDINIAANGTGVINLLHKVVGLSADWTGDTVIVGSLKVDNVTINGSSIDSTGTFITTNSSFGPVGNLQMGTLGQPWQFGHFLQLRDTNSNVFSVNELTQLRSCMYRDLARTQPAQAGDAIFYDFINKVYLASAPDSEIAHASLSGLTTGDAGHTQFALLAGRTGGQTILGGILVTKELVLGPNAVTGATLAVGVAEVYPSADGTYDLGKAGNSFDDLYIKGEGIGLRLQNDTTVNIAAAASATTIGRVWYSTTDSFVYVDLGGTAKKIGQNSYNAVKTNIELGSAITVSADIDDARNAIWQLTDIANADEILGVQITKTATTVTITTDIPLPAGSYRLLGIEL